MMMKDLYQTTETLADRRKNTNTATTQQHPPQAAFIPTGSPPATLAASTSSTTHFPAKSRNELSLIASIPVQSRKIVRTSRTLVAPAENSMCIRGVPGANASATHGGASGADSGDTGLSCQQRRVKVIQYVQCTVLYVVYTVQLLIDDEVDLVVMKLMMS
jgi:hypothetical protein